MQNAENPDLVTFAETMLPTLEEYLQVAKALQAKYAKQQWHRPALPASSDLGGQAPIDRRQTMLLQELIGAAEVPVAEEPAMGRQRRRMG